MLDTEILKAAPQFELPSVAAVAQATLREFSASPLTSTPEFWERIVKSIFDKAAIPAMVDEIGRLHEKRQSLARDVVKLALDNESLRALNAELREEALRLVHTAEGDMLLNQSDEHPGYWSMTTKIAIDCMHTLLAKCESQSATTQPAPLPGILHRWATGRNG